MGARGERVRQEVLESLQQSAGPLSAYDILGQLQVANPKMAPPTVYRALSALMESGHVHRVESLKAYIACDGDAHQTASILLICNECGAVDERVAPALSTQLSNVTSKSGFAPTRHVIEVHGRCGSCCDEPTNG